MGKNQMKSRVGKIMAGALAGGLLLSLLSGCGGETDSDVKSTAVVIENPAGDGSTDTTSTSTASETEDLSGDWNLILVNYDHLLPEDFTVETVQLPGGAYVDERIYDKLMEMLSDCEAEGYAPAVCSGYRDVEKQTELFQAEVQGYIDAGYDEEEATNLAKTEVAAPRTSEHHTGLAVDMIADGIYELEEDFADTDVGKWLAENAHKYGFVLRFPEGKEDITGVIYEPWHFRYVGEEAAKEMYEQNLCLEEYLGVTDSSEQ
jgi:D-alanyl-D-alanine carboxypeptidase